jgi:uncharacterized alpha/beta hydrolase family protein
MITIFLYLVLIFVIIIILFISKGQFSYYRKQRILNNNIKLKNAPPICFLNACDTGYKFSKSIDQSSGI